VKKKKFLLIDGYNIIHAWDELKTISDYSLEAARDNLTDILSNYWGYVDKDIFLVFDAYNVKGNTGSYEKTKNIHVIFTKEAQTADSYIEYFTKVNARTSDICVATSDYMEQIVILNYGAYRISANDLKQMITEAERDMRENYIEKKPIKNNMLFDNLDEHTKKLFEEMIRRKE
jgi:predicted RNA-binding protein with PIN domain